MQKYSFRTKFLFIILLTKFSNKIEFPIHLYMVICQVCNSSNSLKYPKSQIYGIQFKQKCLLLKYQPRFYKENQHNNSNY